MPNDIENKNNEIETELNYAILKEFRYQIEKQGFSVKASDRPDFFIDIYEQDCPVAFLNRELDLFFDKNFKNQQQIIDLFRNVKEYVSAYEKSPVLKQVYNNSIYKNICDFNNAVLAARRMDSGRFEFVTWEYSYKRTGVMWGHYFSDNYSNAKRDFSIRSGLISENEVFTEKELQFLYQACCFSGYENDNLNGGEIDIFKNLLVKIEPLLPNIPKNEKDLEDTEETEHEQ